MAFVPKIYITLQIESYTFIELMREREKEIPELLPGYKTIQVDYVIKKKSSSSFRRLCHAMENAGTDLNKS